MEPSFVTPALASQGRGRLALLADSMRRPGGRRALSVLVAVFFLAAIGLLSYPLATDVYQRHLQGDLKSSFSSPKTVESYKSGVFTVGQGLTRIRIPSISLDVVVVEGTTPAALKAGAGHYVGTPLPGEAGNVAIAGHRTTYGHPFNHLDEVKPGDLILLYTPSYVFTYQSVPSFTSATTFDGTANPHPVLPTDVSVIAQPAAGTTIHELTLTTCNPKGSAAQRLVLRADLIKVADAPGSTAPLPNIHAPSTAPLTQTPALTTLPAPQ